MTAIIKEEKRMDTPAKSYLQMYEEYISGYKQYKREKEALSKKTEKASRVEN